MISHIFGYIKHYRAAPLYQNICLNKTSRRNIVFSVIRSPRKTLVLTVLIATCCGRISVSLINSADMILTAVISVYMRICKKLYCKYVFRIVTSIYNDVIIIRLNIPVVKGGNIIYISYCATLVCFRIYKPLWCCNICFMRHKRTCKWISEVLI